jgi:hypothetical protein
MSAILTCSVEGCYLKNRSLGLCENHYYRNRRYGDPLGGSHTIYKPEGVICEHEECTKPIYSKGFCITHYTRLRRHGSSGGGTTSKGAPLQWIEEHSSHHGADCLTWPYAKAKGYGIVTINGRMRVASNYMCEVVHGAPPTPRHECAHSCGKGNLGCTNPDHLRWATRSENLLERRDHSTVALGSGCINSKLKEHQVIAIRSLQGKERSDDIAERFGVSRALIYRIWNREMWTHI